MGPSVWSPVEDSRCYGVAIYPYQLHEVARKGDVRLELDHGEAVQIKGESPDWFYVQKTGSKEEGIVPKSYIAVRECIVSRNRDEVIVVPRWPPVVQEITSVLLDWHRIANDLYIRRRSEFSKIKELILDLHEFRRKIMSTTYTVEGRRELKKEVANIIDTGNSLLKLDLTVRDEAGHPLDSSSTSTIELFRAHQQATNKLRKQEEGGQRRSLIVTHNSHSLLVTLEKISWRVVDEFEIRMFLYDGTGTEQRPFSESAQITMRASDDPKTRLKDAKFLFTDLGRKDLDKQRVYLVAYVVRVGAMEYKEPEARRENTPFSQRSSQQIRRPWGVAAAEITKIFHESSRYRDEKEDSFFVPYVPYGEYDCMENALQKLISVKEINTKDSKMGFLCGLQMISGNPTQIQEEYPLLMRSNPVITRKMGFPEVILPNDVRNDLYVTLIRGEFQRGSKKSDKNVEVTVSAHNDQGRVLKRLIYGGSGSSACDQYKSVVYYHDDKPHWAEIFKISLPVSIADFTTAHLRFTFKHRSSNEPKDKQEKPFALAFVPLRNADGTAIADGQHELMVYKIDPKHFRESEAQYLALVPWRPKPWESGVKPQCPGFSVSTKDQFFIQTTLCSTKFTQNVQLLELLQWSTKLKNVAERNFSNNLMAEKSQQAQIETLLNELKDVLIKVTKVSGDEIVKFLPDIFDALFLILVDPIESIQSELKSVRQSLVIQPRFFEDGNLLMETCDRPVFECLIYIFGLILNHKYQNFKSVLSLYIEDGFFSALAYKKLIRLMQSYIEESENGSQISLTRVLDIMKSVSYFFKFIVRSFNICMKLRDVRLGQAVTGADGEEIEFEKGIESLFGSMSNLLRRKDDRFLAAQGGCLKHIPSVIADLCTVFPARKLSELLVELIVVVPLGKLSNQKLMTLKEIGDSPLFLEPACRTMLLPSLAQNITNHLPGNDEDLRRRSLENATTKSNSKLQRVLGSEVTDSHARRGTPGMVIHMEETEKCVELLSDVMDILHRRDIGTTEPDISYLMQILLKPIIFSIGTIGDNDPLAGEMVAILLSFFRMMNSRHYAILISSLKGDSNHSSHSHKLYSKEELLKFLNDVLVVMKNLFSKPYFSADWSEMILLQNSVVLTTLEHFSDTVKQEYIEPFEEQPWNNFFQCAVSFLTQTSLQLENFSNGKRLMITSRYGDMRKKAAELIRAMWFSLGESKRVQFVPGIAGTFLDMTLVPEPELRTSTIPIFFDMMRCDYDRHGSIKAVEEELIRRLVEAFENGKGDSAFRDILFDTLTNMCENEVAGLRESGLYMVKTISKLLELLLEYREVIHEDDPSNRMTCIVNLLDFSKEIDRKNLYLRYMYKLHDLHKQCNNFAEAAFTLKLHSRQLLWTEDDIPWYLNSLRHPSAHTQYELKEALYNDTIQYLVLSKMWECALEVCDELKQQYAEESYNYCQLPGLLRQMATFYEEIMKKNRLNPAYFRVAFYGRGFPSFLQDKSYVYRGRESERLQDFEARMLERYPRAELLRFLTAPSEEIKNSSKQYLQICDVKPVMGSSNSKRMSAMKNADECVRLYYKSNEIDKFTYSRAYFREPRETDNEFASRWLERYTLWTSQSFPGIMSWFPVVRETVEQVRPIVHAIEELENKNQDLRDLIVNNIVSPKENVSPLSMMLNGILDAAVMGGIANYEKAFMTDAYLEKYPEDEKYVENLKSCICQQVPILEQGLIVHARKIAQTLIPLHQKLEECYKHFLRHVEEAYNVDIGALNDDKLARETERAMKKQDILAKKNEVLSQRESGGSGRNDDKPPGIVRSTSVAIGRGVGSFSSTISLYADGKKMSNSKSMASISRQDASRRSTQSSLAEVSEFFHGASSSSTLPRNGLFHSLSTGNSGLADNGVATLRNRDTWAPAFSQHNQIPLTQTLTTQRPLRSQMEQRKSQTWLNNGDNRSSGISVSSLQNNISETSSRSSCATLNDVDEDTTAPPLPPKQQKADNRPPTPPPKKPPLRHQAKLDRE